MTFRSKKWVLVYILYQSMVNGQEVILAVGMHFSGHFYCGEVAVGKGWNKSECTCIDHMLGQKSGRCRDRWLLVEVWLWHCSVCCAPAFNMQQVFLLLLPNTTEFSEPWLVHVHAFYVTDLEVNISLKHLWKSDYRS